MTKLSNQQGFTIIELLIATVIFSLVLLLCVTGAIQIGRYFYKGISLSRAQNTTRTVMDEFSNAIQFSGIVPSSHAPKSYPSGPTVSSICFGNIRYSYVLNHQLDDDVPGGYNDIQNKSRHVLWRDTQGLIDGCEPKDLRMETPVAGGSELVASGMRLTQLNVAVDQGNLWNIDVRVVYGDEDLLTTTTPVTCIGSVQGGAFCGASEEHTSVFRRLE